MGEWIGESGVPVKIPRNKNMQKTRILFEKNDERCFSLKFFWGLRLSKEKGVLSFKVSDTSSLQLGVSFGGVGCI